MMAPMSSGLPSGRQALAAALRTVWQDSDAARVACRSAVEAAWPRARESSHIVGITGPPGVGKSTLIGSLVRQWRSRGLTVAVLCVDPSSRRTGGALLGDRARITGGRGELDEGVFIRSVASAGQLGGLAPGIDEALILMAAAADIVVVETVGVGQSEIDVTSVVDTTVVSVQPGSGDTLQHLKAGLMEVPDLLLVHKADLGVPARRMERELRGAVRLLGGETPVLAASAQSGEGIEALVGALEERRAELDPVGPARRERMLGRRLAAFAAHQGQGAVERLGGEEAALAMLRGLGAVTPGAVDDALAASLR